MSGVYGSLVVWGLVQREDGDVFDVTIGERPLSGCLLPFDGTHVHVLRAFAANSITPVDLPGLQAAVLDGVVAAAAGYRQPDWSEVTPGDYCDEECSVGGHDLRAEFFHYVGQHCVLVASTLPIDVAEFERGG